MILEYEFDITNIAAVAHEELRDRLHARSRAHGDGPNIGVF